MLNVDIFGKLPFDYHGQALGGIENGIGRKVAKDIGI